MSHRTDALDAAHRQKIFDNENEVIAAASAADPNDRSARTEYVREVAEDIVARRAASN